MSIRQPLGRAIAALALVSTVIACSSNDKAPYVQSATDSKPDLPHFNDISTAPSKIQTAARAVVRVRTAQALGTGSFISASGLLLTNNHVLGEAVCPIEGCYFAITLQHQKGQSAQDPKAVYAKPVAVDVGLDMAALQLFETDQTTQLDTPDYLSFDNRSPAELLDEHVTIVGHPEGNLKKWTDGVVVDTSGDWFTSTAFTLPGDSGSPILNDDGLIVGLIHRGPQSLDLITDNGINVYSVGTASAPISNALNASLPTTMVSNVAATTTAKFLANAFVYINSNTRTITVDGTSVGTLSVLAQTCDAALKRTDFTSPDDLLMALQPCYDASTWLGCRSDLAPPPYGAICPEAAEQAAWATRFQDASNLQVVMNGQPDYFLVSFAVAALASSVAAGHTAGAASLQQMLSNTSPDLDFRLAYYLAAFDIDSYASTNISAYITGYKQVSHYQMQASYIAFGATWLMGNGHISSGTTLSLMRSLMNDSEVSIGNKLSIEDALYEMGAL